MNPVAERATDRDDGLPQDEAMRVADRRCRQAGRLDLDDREVRRTRDPVELARELAPSASVTVIELAPSTTWALVRIQPRLSKMIPEPTPVAERNPRPASVVIEPPWVPWRLE